MKIELSHEIIKLFGDTGERIQSILHKLRTARDPQGMVFALKAPVLPGNENIIDLFARIRTVCALGHASKAESFAALVSDSQLEGLKNGLVRLRAEIDNLLKAVPSNDLIKLIGSDGLSYTDQSDNPIDLKGYFDNLYTAYEFALQYADVVSRVKRQSNDKSIVALETSLSAIIKRISNDYEDSKARAGEASAALSKIVELKALSESAASETKRISEEVKNARTTIQEYMSEAASHVAAAREVANDSKSLRSEVSNYRAEFLALQKEMDDRKTKIDQGTNEVNALVDQVDSWRKEINGLISRAEEMLSLTTTAGLAANYYKIVQTLTKELFWARVGFYLGIGVLFLSAAPLFAQAIIPLAALFDPSLQKFAEDISRSSGDTGWHIAQIFGRLVILVPAAWLVSFSARRHSSLFKLREHYSYKYSMAASVEGFKKEAVKYGEEIAATVFTELTFNPADKLDHKELENHRPPNPILDRLLQMLQREEPEAKTS